MDTKKLIENINNTGFVLEYEVAHLFEENGWSVINNRYYLDDDSQRSREIDILAYKVREIDETFYYTSLIISCKKSNEHLWTFLVKNLDEKDPNIEKYPIIDWSNNPIIDFMKKKQEFTNKVITGINSNENVRFTYGVDEQVFAFQQLDKKSYKPKNDKDIYNSIMTSIKALEYERNALNNRIDRDAVYNFNILSIFDGEMCSLKYNGTAEPEVNEINDIKYLNRHIVNKTDLFFRVHFLNYVSLKKCIKYYDGLHDWHVNVYSNLKKEFEKLMMEEKDESCLDLLLEDFKKKIYWKLIDTNLGERIDVTSLTFDKNNKMKVNCDIENGDYDKVEKSVLHFNEDMEVNEEIRIALEEVYGYSGDFYFCNDGLPF